tara:strand:- start:654 stop:830 length:177 start_codon:yes stop_codon:yes gene_type:complete
MNKSQIIGLLIAIVGVSLGLFWEKSFKYDGFFDFIMGAFGAIGICLVFKILPPKRKSS